jgi:hypothetical protein
MQFVSLRHKLHVKLQGACILCLAINNHCQGFFQGFFRAVKRPQKLNLELSFETQFSHQSFSAVKMKLFELNL